MNQPSDVISELREIKRRLSDLTKRVGLSSAVISRGGLTITDGGELVLIDENGTVIFKIGEVDFGGASSGMLLRFDSGNWAFSLGGTPGSQAWALWDESGSYLVTNDAVTGHGLGRPFLNIPMYPSSDSEHHTGGPLWPATTSSSFVELMHGFTALWNPRLRFGMDTTSTGGDTEWRLLLSGDLIAEGSGDIQGTYEIPGWGDTVLPGHERVIQVEVRNSEGLISWAQVDKCYGIES